MKILHTIDIPIPNGVIKERRSGKQYNCTHMECELGYRLGGVGMLTFKSNPRGYYISVTPVTIGDHCVSSILGSGYCCCILECARQSPKKEREARKMFKEKLRPFLDEVYDTSGIEHKEVE